MSFWHRMRCVSPLLREYAPLFSPRDVMITVFTAILMSHSTFLQISLYGITNANNAWNRLELTFPAKSPMQVAEVGWKTRRNHSCNNVTLEWRQDNTYSEQVLWNSFWHERCITCEGFLYLNKKSKAASMGNRNIWIWINLKAIRGV